MNIVNARPLPSIAAFAPGITRSIIQQVDDLYRSMAALDYRQRLTDFEHIFLKVNKCILILENEAKIAQWRDRRAKERAATLEKQRRKLLRMQGQELR